MMKISKPLRLACAVGLLSLAASLSCSAQSKDPDAVMNELFGNKVIAKGKGVKVLQGQLDESVVTIKATAAAKGRPIPPTVDDQIEREVLQRLINIQLLGNQATDEDKAKGKQIAEERIKMLTERAGGEKPFARSLTAVGLTPEKLHSKLIEESIAQVVLERELGIKISDEDVKKYYDENPAKFEQPEMVRAAHILLRTTDPVTGDPLSPDDKAERKRKIEELRQKALNGADFAQLAREYSEDEASREEGGEYTFPRGRMVPAFEATAFSLPPGKISDVIETRFGYHIIKVYEKIPAKTVDLDEDVAKQIREFLKAKESRERMEPLVKKLADEAGVQILVERLKPVEKPTDEESALPSTEEQLLSPETQ